MGIKELKEVVDLLAALMKMVDAAMADGKVDMSDLSLLMSLVPVVGPAIQGIGMVDDELKDMSEEEIAEMKAYMDSKFGAGSYEKIGKEVLSCSLSIAKIIKIIQGMKAA